MKKHLLLFVLILSFLFTGCTSSEKDAIYKTMSGYLDALKDGDFESAQKYCDASYYDALGIQSFTSNLDTQLKEIDLGEDFNRDAKEFVKNVTMKTILKYEIKDYTQNDDTAVVTVNLTGVDLSEVNVKKAQENAMQEYTQYMTDHFTELNEILNTKGEEAMKEVLVKELSSMLFNNLNAEMDKTKPKERTVDFYLKKIDGQWKVASPNNDKEEAK